MNVEAKVSGYLDKIREEDGEINAFLELNENVIEEARAIDGKNKKGKLAGVVVAVKSNINVKDLTASCASKTLENYKSSFDASVIEKIKGEDGVIIGMLNCDEFACGSSGETSAFGATDNPSARGFVPGGSSSGSAAAVAAGFCDVSLGSDTGGSVRVPASFCGVVGMKPSYGAVSRYGLIDLSMSLDQIGPLGRNVNDVRRLFEVISGRDDRDATTIELEDRKRVVKKIGVLNIKGASKEIENHIKDALGLIKSKLKIAVEDVDIKMADLAVQTYHPIVWTEFFSATRRFDGRRYGRKIEESAGEEVLRRIFGGSEISKEEFSGQYYKKALSVKREIAEEFREAFKRVDCIICPTAPLLPWRTGTKLETYEMYSVDKLVIPANLAGICAISIPCGKINGRPVGLQVMFPRGCDFSLLDFSETLEGLFH